MLLDTAGVFYGRTRLIPPLLFCLPASAQVHVAGKVTNENDLPLAGARITIAEIPPPKAWEAISDPTGAFVLLLRARPLFA